MYTFMFGPAYARSCLSKYTVDQFQDENVIWIFVNRKSYMYSEQLFDVDVDKKYTL